jgi:hypothetical protein
MTTALTSLSELTASFWEESASRHSIIIRIMESIGKGVQGLSKESITTDHALCR